MSSRLLESHPRFDSAQTSRGNFALERGTLPSAGGGGAGLRRIFMLDPEGKVVTWNPGAEPSKATRADEIIRQPFSRFYPQEAVESGWPAHELEVARTNGRFEDEGWRVRKDGTQFWANVIITALRDEGGSLLGFSKITRDMTERKLAEENSRRLLQEEAARKTAQEFAQLIQEQREQLRVTLTSIGDTVIATDARGPSDIPEHRGRGGMTGWTSKPRPTERRWREVFRIVNERTRRPVENPAERSVMQNVSSSDWQITPSSSPRTGPSGPLTTVRRRFRDQQGAILGAVLVFRDVTERRQAQLALRRRGRLRFQARHPRYRAASRYCHHRPTTARLSTGIRLCRTNLRLWLAQELSRHLGQLNLINLVVAKF